MKKEKLVEIRLMVPESVRDVLMSHCNGAFFSTAAGSVITNICQPKPSLIKRLLSKMGVRY